MKQKIHSHIFAILLAFIGIVSTAPQQLPAAAIHALLVGDTLDQTIGPDCAQDLYHMEELIRDVMKHTGLQGTIAILKDTEATTENVLNYMTALNVQRDDVIFLYFSMHGYRTSESTTQWPNLYFGQEEMGLDLDYITKFGKQKGPRLIISIADVCNNSIPDDWVETIRSQGAKSLRGLSQKQVAQNYNNLFVRAAGSITVSGSIPGEYSWSFHAQGGAYTMSFLESIKSVTTNSTNASWNQVLNLASETVKEKTAASGMQKGQNPQHEISLK